MKLTRCSLKYAMKLGVQQDPTAFSQHIHQSSGNQIGRGCKLHGYRHDAPFSQRGYILQLWGFGTGDHYRLYC